MMENDPLRSVLQEWEAPEVPPSLDAKVRAAFRERSPASPWWLFWRARVSVPVPVLAGLLLIAMALILKLRPLPQASAEHGLAITQVDAKGFVPVPDGAVRVVPAGGIQQ
jgi:anti-sigma factor RsiW